MDAILIKSAIKYIFTLFHNGLVWTYIFKVDWHYFLSDRPTVKQHLHCWALASSMPELCSEMTLVTSQAWSGKDTLECVSNCIAPNSHGAFHVVFFFYVCDVSKSRLSVCCIKQRTARFCLTWNMPHSHRIDMCHQTRNGNLPAAWLIKLASHLATS